MSEEARIAALQEKIDRLQERTSIPWDGTGIFGPLTLRRAIVKVWGEAGAHVDVYDELLKRAGMEVEK